MLVVSIGFCSDDEDLHYVPPGSAYFFDRNRGEAATILRPVQKGISHMGTVMPIDEEAAVREDPRGPPPPFQDTLRPPPPADIEPFDDSDVDAFLSSSTSGCSHFGSTPSETLLQLETILHLVTMHGLRQHSLQ